MTNDEPRLTKAEWRALWAEDRARIFGVACGLRHSKLLSATRIIIGECLAQGASFEQFRQIIEILKSLYDETIQEATAAGLLAEIRDLLSNGQGTPQPTDSFWDDFVIPDGWKMAQPKRQED